MTDPLLPPKTIPELPYKGSPLIDTNKIETVSDDGLVSVHALMQDINTYFLAKLLTAPLPPTNGGTGLSSYTIGDLLAATGPTVLSQLPDIVTGNVLLSGGVGAVPFYGKVGLTTHVTGNLPVANLAGGSGASASTYWRGDGTWAAIPSGSGTVTSVSGVGTVNGLTLTGTVTTSGNLTLGGALTGISLTTQVTGTLPAASGGTGITSYAIGDIIYASGATTLSKLADVATGNVLLSGGVTTAPSWGKVGLTTHVSGILGVANGGSGAATLTGYVKGNGTSPFTASASIPPTDITGLTTVGMSFITVANPSAITFPRVNADNSLTLLDAASFRTAIGAGAGGSGTVTSVSGAGTVNGLTLTGTVTTSGSITLGGTLSNVDLTTQVTGTLPVGNGGTGQSTYAVGDLLYASASATLSKLAAVATGNALISSGVTTAPVWGKIALATHISGTLPVANGGTGAVTLTGYVKGSGTSALTASATIPVADVTGAVPEAAIDGQQYGRKDAAWTIIDSFGAAVADWNWNATTTSNPAAGTIRANNATQTSATVIWIDGSTITGSDIANYLTMAIKVGQLLYIQDKSNAANWNAWTVTSLPTYDAPNTYFSVPVSWSQGGASIPVGRVSVTLIDPVGSSATGDVVGPGSAVADNLASFNGTTGKLIKDSGKAAPAGAIVGTTDTQTLTNKRINPRTGTTASSATPAINSDNVDFYSITALAAAITSFTMTGTPVDAQTLWIAITDNGTARAIAWGTSFEASTVALPTTTVISTRLDVGFVWNVATTKWRCVAVA